MTIFDLILFKGIYNTLQERKKNKRLKKMSQKKTFVNNLLSFDENQIIKRISFRKAMKIISLILGVLLLIFAILMIYEKLIFIGVMFIIFAGAFFFTVFVCATQNKMYKSLLKWRREKDAGIPSEPGRENIDDYDKIYSRLFENSTDSFEGLNKKGTQNPLSDDESDNYDPLSR